MSVNTLEKSGSFLGAIGKLIVECVAQGLRPGSFFFDGDDDALVKRRVVKAT
jgi:hypothetical protein